MRSLFWCIKNFFSDKISFCFRLDELRIFVNIVDEEICENIYFFEQNILFVLFN
jgi:hypothetical protein